MQSDLDDPFHGFGQDDIRCLLSPPLCLARSLSTSTLSASPRFSSSRSAACLLPLFNMTRAHSVCCCCCAATLASFPIFSSSLFMLPPPPPHSLSLFTGGIHGEKKCNILDNTVHLDRNYVKFMLLIPRLKAREVSLHPSTTWCRIHSSLCVHEKGSEYIWSAMEEGSEYVESTRLQAREVSLHPSNI